MKRYIIVSLLLCSVSGYAQKKALNFPASAPANKINEYKTLAGRMCLQDLTTSQEPVHFRYWTAGSVVDIWSDDGTSFAGTLTNHTSAPSRKFARETTYYYKRKPIDAATAGRIYIMLAEKHTFDKNVSTANSDGYAIEYATRDTYMYIPSDNGASQEIAQVLQLGTSRNAFARKLPKRYRTQTVVVK